MKRVAAAVVLGLLVVAVAGAADSTDPRVKITKADQAHAAAGVLHVADLGPAWTGGAEKPNSLKIPICPGNTPNDSDLTITGHAESRVALASAGLQIDSDVEIFKTPAQVAKLVQRTMGPNVANCVEYDLLKSVGTTGVTVAGVKQIPVVKAGDRAVLYRATVKVKSGSSSVGVYSDFLFLSKGRTQFFVNVVAPASVASELPGLENRIAKTLAARAKA